MSKISADDDFALFLYRIFIRSKEANKIRYHSHQTRS